MVAADHRESHRRIGQGSAPDGGYRVRWSRAWPLLRTLTLREYRARYRQSVLDLGWSLVTPLTTLAVYGVIFSVAFKVDGEGVPYLAFVWTGLVVWAVFSTGLSQGSTALLQNADLMSKVYFPREVLPLAMVGTSLIDFAISFTVLVVIVAVQIQSVTLCAIAIIPAVGMVLIWTSALAILTAAASVFVRDIAQVIQLFLRVAILATPVMYGPAALPDSLQFLVWANPVAVGITALRDAVLFQVWPEWPLLAVHTALGLVLLLVSVAYVRSVEHRMIDVI